MILDRKEKQPAEILDYTLSYAEWLGGLTDTLDVVDVSVVCVTDPADTALLVHRVITSSTAVSVWLAGGTDGQRYKITVTATTVAGRRDQSEFIMRIREH